MIEICNIKTEKPKHEYDVKVCRGYSILGNPYFMKNESERDKVCDDYANWLSFNIDKPDIKNEITRLTELYKKHGKLRLFCFCYPKRCHAETIRTIIQNKVGEINAKQ